MANVVPSWLEDKGVGFQPTDVEAKGKCLFSTLADALWVIDGHLETLSDRSYATPTEFSCFSGYNVPGASKHKRKTLERTAVEVNACKLFELLEKPWMSKGRCSVIREPVEKLAQSLHGYSTYLLSQSKKVAANHALLHPVRADDNSISFLDPVSTIRPTVCERYKPLNDTLLQKQEYEPILLSEFCPDDAIKRRNYIDNMSQGIQHHCAKFTHAFGG